MKALLIYVDGSVKRVEINGLADLQKHVGGYIEGVQVSGTSQFGYVNEEGLLLGLEQNPLASKLTNTYIVGNMVVLGPVDKNGNNTDVSEAFCKDLGL
jgi:hypothetical protein